MSAVIDDFRNYGETKTVEPPCPEMQDAHDRCYYVGALSCRVYRVDEIPDWVMAGG
jgi:hypothetical protein